MLQLYVTDDRGAVTACHAEVFPFIIGRSAQAQLRLTSAGVWEEHASIRLDDTAGPSETRFLVESIGQSLVSVNGEVIPAKRLAMGDEILLGAARIVVSLSPARQSRLAWHEFVVWALLMTVVVSEAVIILLAR